MTPRSVVLRGHSLRRRPGASGRHTVLRTEDAPLRVFRAGDMKPEQDSQEGRGSSQVTTWVVNWGVVSWGCGVP